MSNAISTTPVFSIVIPVYNGASTLERALNSAFNQSYDTSQYEVLAVDDGSLDNSEALLRQYSTRIGTPHFRYRCHKENLGTGHARNTGCDMARGAYVLYLDADDELCADCLEHFERGLDMARDSGLVNPLLVASHETIFENGTKRVIKAPRFSAHTSTNFRKHINGQKRIAVCGAYVVPRAFYTQHHFPTQFPTAEDFIYCGWALAVLPPWTVSQITARIYRSAKSRRSSTVLNETMIKEILNTLFDKQIVSKNLRKMRRECQAALYLSALRRARQNNDYDTAISCWNNALRTHPATALQTRHLRGVLRAHIGAFTCYLKKHIKR